MTHSPHSPRTRLHRPGGTVLPLVLLVVVIGALAVALSVALPWMRVNRGIFHHMQHNHAETVATLSGAALDPPDFRPVHYLIASHLALGQTDVALARLEAIQADHAQWAEPHLEEALIHLRAGRLDEAEAAAGEAMLRSSADSPLPLQGDRLALAQAIRAVEEGRLRASLENLEPFAESASDQEDVIAFVRGLALYRLNRWGEAREALERSLALSGDNPRAAAMMALVLLSEGDWHHARLWADRARALDFEIAAQVLIPDMRRQMRLASEAETQDLSAAAIPLEDGIMWICELLTQGDDPDWEYVLVLIEDEHDPEEIDHWAVWHVYSDALRAIGADEEKEEALDRVTELNPNWGVDPTWTVPREQTLVSLSARRWQDITLPEGDLLGGVAGRYGEDLENVLIHTGGAIEMPVGVPTSGWYRVMVSAYGNPASDVWPLIEIRTPPVPGVAKYVNSLYPRYHVATVFMEEGINMLEIAYLNDDEFPDPERDRSVVITEVLVETVPLAEEI